MRAPRRMFRKRKAECDVIITPESRGRSVILSDPEPSDLQGYSKPIRSRWWRAYREEGIENPIVVAVHRRSRLAKGLCLHTEPGAGRTPIAYSSGLTAGGQSRGIV